MIKKILFIIIGCFFTLIIQAQQEDETNDDLSFKSIENGLERPNYILKLALLSLLDFNSPSLQLGIELKVNKWLGVHQELGYVNNWLNPIYTLFDHDISKKIKFKNGFKYIIEPRFYFLNKNEYNNNNNNNNVGRIFFAPALDFRYVVIQRKEWVIINNSYQKMLKYNVQRVEYGLNLKLGISGNSKMLLPIEMAIGLGVRYISLVNTLPKNSQIVENRNIFVFNRPPIEGNTWMPSAYIGMLLYLPTKKKHKVI